MEGKTRICSPPFMVLNTECNPDVLEQIKLQGLTFPFICKTRVAHGTNSHEMAIVFSEEDLKDVKPPCVIQSFINHNAVLYKVFVVGESYSVVERPSLKNFPSGPAERKAIFFNSHNVSKPESSSDLTSNVEGVSHPPCDDVIRELSRSLRQALGVSLFGIDVIINNQTGQHAVIDINAFPGTRGEAGSVRLNHLCLALGSGAETLFSLSGAGPQVPGCSSSIRGKELQRLGCNSAVSPNFQQHCVSTIATKASSQ
uniref:inositol-1,3,4-trisphosphate 5/6-kinase n=1 Tax=Fundulus heteroclitus TaxID=8078 RepID=A0A3Q2P750_FUNHE